MTNDQLDGRDLDRACGEAMGWTKHNGPIGWCKPSGRRERHGMLPEFSTDPSTQAEKLAFLRQHGLSACHWGRDDSGLDEWTLEGAGGEVLVSLLSARDMWDVALARLIVVWAKAKKE